MPRRRQLNPAFASAHGLVQKQHLSRGSLQDNDNQSSQDKVDSALRLARSTARLNLSSCSLNVAALPDAMFDLRGSIEIDLNLDSTENPGSWMSYGEQDIVCLDISDCNVKSKDKVLLDSRLVQLVSLRSLRARRSNIGCINWGDIARFDNIVTLDISGNELTIAKIEWLPMTVTEIDLSKNKIKSLVELPDSSRSHAETTNEPVVVLPNLIRLDVSDNHLRKFPSSIEVPSLQVFCFGNNQISDLLASTDMIAQCAQSLTTLEGPNNQLHTILDLSECKKLTTIDLSDNKLSDIPSISNEVVRLNLTNNTISSMSGLFGDAQQLNLSSYRSNIVELRLRGNKICGLDGHILSCMTNATFIDVGQNELMDVPDVLGYLPNNLRRLLLDGNPTQVLRTPLLTNTSALKAFLRKRGPPPQGDGYLGEERNGDGAAIASASLCNNAAKSIVNQALVGPFILDLSGKGLNTLPRDIGNELLLPSTHSYNESDADSFAGEHIQQLNVSRNTLKSLDDWLAATPNVTRLDATQNKIENLPGFIGDVPLVELRISRNSLSSLSLANSLTCCFEDATSTFVRSISYIDLSGNHLKWVPAAFAKLPALSTLVLANNMITTLKCQDVIGSEWPPFKSLENLDLSGNKITDLANLPNSLASSAHIKRLSLANNELSIIPPTLGLLQSLTSIDLRGNPQRGIRMSILECKASEILSFLRSRIDVKELQKLQFECSSNSCTMESETSMSSTKYNKTLEGLRRSIQDITLQLNNVYLTEAQKQALQINKANLIKEERCILSKTIR